MISMMQSCFIQAYQEINGTMRAFHITQGDVEQVDDSSDFHSLNIAIYSVNPQGLHLVLNSISVHHHNTISHRVPILKPPTTDLDSLYYLLPLETKILCKSMANAYNSGASIPEHVVIPVSRGP
jgi:hypothetical protein